MVTARPDLVCYRWPIRRDVRGPALCEVSGTMRILHPKLRWPLACGLFLLAGPGLTQAPPAEKVSAPAASATSEERRLDRLMGLCRAWNTAKYLHPALWSSDLDWDAAFVTAATTIDGTSDTAA